MRRLQRRGVGTKSRATSPEPTEPIRSGRVSERGTNDSVSVMEKHKPGFSL